jgi:hypothetical protein
MINPLKHYSIVGCIMGLKADWDVAGDTSSTPHRYSTSCAGESSGRRAEAESRCHSKRHVGLAQGGNIFMPLSTN